MSRKESIYVTKSFLPPLKDYEKYLRQIWENDQLTNQGPLLLQLESELQNYLNIDSRVQVVSNGTSALQIALRALDITEGEIITTPFSYVATTSAIMWQNCDPVYVDIDHETLCIDPLKIEEAITPKTKAIMPVHVFGNPCDIEAIDAIAKKHNLKVIYDAAHAFGVKYKGKSLLDYGDISVCSFHATKLFHTIEGGCIVSQDKAVSNKIELLKRFGHNGDEHYTLGINAKASEFQAAMGLCNLKYIDSIIEKRRKTTSLYDELLSPHIKTLKLSNNTVYNFAYYPIILGSEEQLLDVLKALEADGIFPRRYFYPALNRLPYLDSPEDCAKAESISKRILCLPLYDNMEKQITEKICTAVNNEIGQDG